MRRANPVSRAVWAAAQTGHLETWKGYAHAKGHLKRSSRYQQPSRPKMRPLDKETELLHVVARIAWRQGTALGLAFCELAHDHSTRVDTALDTLLSMQSGAPKCLARLAVSSSS